MRLILTTQKPSLSLPPSLAGAEKGSFAEDTIIRRMPNIARQVLADNQLTTPAATAVQTLIAEIPDGQIRPLTDVHAPDTPFWQRAIEPMLQQNWLTAPWFFSETYFYRRIIEAVDYFGTGFDPFLQQKTKATSAEPNRLLALVDQLNVALTVGWNSVAFRQLLAADLWGNQVDLSLWATDDANKPDHTDDSTRHSHTLVDNSTAVITHLDSLSSARIDFILDNAGFELLSDLALTDYLLTSGKADSVHLHVKLHPTFVSDATADDVLQTFTFLSGHASELVRHMGNRLGLALGNGRLQLHVHTFWTSPHPLWLLPNKLRQLLSESNLVISKGDANYRRALGDAHWAYDTPIAEVVNYFPAPILFLRTCKSDVLAGLPSGRQTELDKLEPGWDINGRWGVIQFVP